MDRIKVVKTIWIAFLTLLVGTVILGIISQTIDYVYGKDSLMSIFGVGVFGSLLSFGTYGIVFWPPVLLITALIEFFLIDRNSDHYFIIRLFIVESALISIPFIYWAINEDYPIWFYFILVFGLSQYLRLIYIKRHHYGYVA